MSINIICVYLKDRKRQESLGEFESLCEPKPQFT